MIFGIYNIGFCVLELAFEKKMMDENEMYGWMIA